MGDSSLRSKEQRLAIANAIMDGIYGKSEPDGPWPAIDESATPFDRCEQTRTKTGWGRCLDARCDRCWSNLPPELPEDRYTEGPGAPITEDLAAKAWAAIREHGIVPKRLGGRDE